MEIIMLLGEAAHQETALGLIAAMQPKQAWVRVMWCATANAGTIALFLCK
jgi:hypothetical protein